MGGTITLTMSLVMIALFSVAIIGFAIGFANDNEVPDNLKITESPSIDTLYEDTRTNVDTFRTDSKGTYDSILDTTIEPGSDVAQSTGPFAISVTNLVGVGTNIITVPYKEIFGGNEENNRFAIFFTVFGSIIAILFGFYVYKTLRGNP